MRIKATIGRLKGMSLETLGGHWTTALILTLFSVLFSGVNYGLSVYLQQTFALRVAVEIVLSFIGFYFSLGLYIGMLRYSRFDYPTVGCIFDASRYYLKSLLYYVPTGLLGIGMNLALSLLELLPQEYIAFLPLITLGFLGALFGISVLLAGFMPMLPLLIDNPDIKPGKLYVTAWKLMRGNKIKLVGLQFSFMGWMLLCLFTCGIGFLFLIPYMQISECMYYNQLITEQKQREEPTEEKEPEEQ